MQEANGSSTCRYSVSSHDGIIQVNIIQLKVFERGFKTLGNLRRMMLMIPQLARHPDFRSISTPVFNPLTYFILIPIDMRTIDMRVPGLQSDFYRIANFTLLR